MPSLQPVTHFVGRSSELAQLRQHVQPGQIVTLCGPGGVGKTALSRMALNDPEILARFPDGMIVHPFYQEKLAEQAWGRIARECDLDPRPDARAAAAQALAQRRCLLVLDGAEVAADLRAVVQVRGPHCGLLITSQNRSHTWHKRIDVKPLPDDEARRLLELWADLQLEGDAAAALQQSLGNLPLALRLVGSYLDATGMSAADYLGMPEPEQLHSLDARPDQFPERSLLTVLARSLSRVTPAAKEVCALVGVLAQAPFEGQEMTAVLGERTGAALRQLVQFGLLEREDAHYRVSHALVHRYAHQFLKKKVSPGAVARLADYYTQLALRESERGLAGYNELDKMRPHLLACLKACTRIEAWRECIDLVWAVDDYLDLRGYWQERQTMLAQGVAAAQQLKQRNDESVFIARMGLVNADLGQMIKAIDQYKQALAISQTIGDKPNEGAWLDNLGNAYVHLGEMETAVDYFQQALTISQEIGDKQGEGRDLGNLGIAYHHLGELKTAITYFQQALAIQHEIGDKRGESSGLGNLGLVYAALGDIKTAIAHYQQALATACEIGDKRVEGNQLGNLGLAYVVLGEVEKAIAHHQHALAIQREIEDKRGEGNQLGNLGIAYANLGDIETAIAHYQQALIIAREIGDKRNEGNQLGNLGNAYISLGEVEKAKSYYEQALTIAETIGDQAGAANRAWNLGALLAEDDPAQAIALMSRLVAYEEAIGHPDAASDAEYVATIRRRLSA